MNKEECELCIKYKTMYCPNSSECYMTQDKPYYQNRIMLLEENKQLKANRDEAIEEIKDLLEHWRGNDLVERDLNILLSLLERGKEC